MFDWCQRRTPMRAITRTLMILLCAVPILSHGQETFDGNWLKKCVDSYNRVTVTHTGNDEDVRNGIALIHYVGGMLAVHRLNNLMATLIVAGTEKSSDSKEKGKTVDDPKVRVALAFTPLFR